MSDAESRSSDRLLARYEAEATKYRRQRDALKAKLAEKDEALTKLTKERDDAVKASTRAADDLKAAQDAAAAAPTKDKDRIAELEAKIRARAHRDAFEKAAAGKIKPSALDAAWKLSEYTPEGDEPDEAKITELVGSLITSHDFLKESNDSASAGAVTPSPRGTVNPQSGATRRDIAADRGAAPKPAANGLADYKPKYPNGRLA